MKPYPHANGVNQKGFWISPKKHHVVQLGLDSINDFNCRLRDWTTGDEHAMPRVAVGDYHPVPDAVVDAAISDAGFVANAGKLWDLGARFHLVAFTVRHGHIVWSGTEQDFQLVVPESAVTLDALRQAVVEHCGATVAAELLQRASRIAFHNAGREPLELTPPDVKGA